MLECDHPFLLGLDCLFQSELQFYLVMPFIRGGELFKIQREMKRFSEEMVKFYAVQVILAVGYLHSKGIIHGDLKPENILVDHEGYLKLVDYGLTKVLKVEQEPQAFCGTAEYLAPEVIT